MTIVLIINNVMQPLHSVDPGPSRCPTCISVSYFGLCLHAAYKYNNSPNFVTEDTVGTGF